MPFTTRESPHLIKYMGSKSKIIDFVIEGINSVHIDGNIVCDLFSGSCTIAGALRGQAKIHSNDIQEYSSILAYTYLLDYNWKNAFNLKTEILEKAFDRVNSRKNKLSNLIFTYQDNLSLKEFNDLEKSQQDLKNSSLFNGLDYYLFAKNYSGTYWSFDQCIWIDSLRAVADEYKSTNYYYPILASLMFAMSYNSQSTGHYAQFRHANTTKSMDDILVYRRKEIAPFFERKFQELSEALSDHVQYPPIISSIDFVECLENLPPNTTVYADPPYCFVHYSRFYHALETLVKYDYPKLMYTGRYRVDRYQSPFCIKSKVRDTFTILFQKVYQKSLNLVLSYSNTGMIALDELEYLAHLIFPKNYTIEVRFLDHIHSTMGRKEDKSRDVKEALILISKL